MNYRIISSSDIKRRIIDMIREASFILPDTVMGRFMELRSSETTDQAKSFMTILIENAEIAQKESIPLCQDCGAVIVFLEIGQDVLFEGDLIASINEGVACAYKDFYLRKSIVEDPLKRINNNCNTPAFIHAEITPGDRLKMTVYLKGGGSENMTLLKMFRPTTAIDDIIDYIAESVLSAGPNPCPPLFLGIGIGGTADVALLNSKKAILNAPGGRNADPYYADLEERIMDRLNSLGVGPLGLGGRSTVASVNILTAPTHIATLPVALNMNCHSLRFRTDEL